MVYIFQTISVSSNAPLRTPVCKKRTHIKRCGIVKDAVAFKKINCYWNGERDLSNMENELVH